MKDQLTLPNLHAWSEEKKAAAKAKWTPELRAEWSVKVKEGIAREKARYDAMWRAAGFSSAEEYGQWWREAHDQSSRA